MKRIDTETRVRVRQVQRDVFVEYLMEPSVAEELGRILDVVAKRTADAGWLNDARALHVAANTAAQDRREATA